ncbi:MFS transporter [Nodosilinea sp. P-1105]|uniref:MFS transporter n=1 Tax=Nodosilinea sp. P-1105 TaxID=2546229 RepID=UPI001469CDCB|nr:MFS transporter [Nodosilinea sp. P-1105]NMF82535.1 MFS transporter [Nodosilinea sp. P-1105]
MIGWFSGLAHPTTWITQVPGPGVTTPEEAALIFSGPQFFIALVSGLVLAFGFQLLLTNLSVAVGIAYAGHGKSANPSKSSGGGPKITTAFGIWTLITVSLALFFACLLAVRLSLYSSALLGAITGLVIWGTYFCLLFWVSSTTVGSLIGSVVKTATSSFQSLVGTATAAIGARAASNQVVETAEATAAAVRQELLAGWNSSDMQDTLRDYLMTLRSPSLDTADLEAEFERLIQDSKVTALADGDTLAQIDRRAFEDLVSRRTDLSPQDTKRLADRLYRSWQRAVGQTTGRDVMVELVDYLKSARRDELVSERLNERIDQLISAQGSSAGGKGTAGLLAQGVGLLMGTVLNRTDLSDLDLAQVTQTLKQLPHQVSDSVDTIATQIRGDDQPYSVVQMDVDAYLYSAYPWQLQPQRLKQEFWDVIYDPTADPALLRQELLPLNRAYFAEQLAARGLLTQAEIQRVANLLDEVRQQALGEVTTRYQLEAAKTLQTNVYTFLQRSSRADLLDDQVTGTFAELIDDPLAEPGELRDRFQAFSYQVFLDALQARQDLSETEAQALASRLEQVMNRVQADAEGLQAAAQARIDNQWQALKHYLQGTGKAELNPKAIQQDIQALLDEPDVGIHRVRQRLAQFDRDTLVQLLSQRHDLSEAQVQQTLDQVEATWYQTIHAPANLTAQAKAKYDEATQAIESYLLKTGKPELNPEGIKRDLSLLIDDPKLGFQAVRDRLAQMDRDTLVQLLGQRQDLSPEEVDRIIDDMQGTIRDLLHMPQRLARRAKAEVMSFEQALEDYLRNTDKAALNPEGIKRDLKLLLEDPRLGADRLQTRLAMIDRDAVVALLAQRPDMTQAEAEAAVDRLLAIRQQIMDQLHRLQDQVKAVIDGILERIRQYLDSLDRPELDYYGIKRDLQQLMDDPKAGLDALRQRLHQVDRDTLVAVLSSHDAISETDAQRVINQVDEVRTTALRKAEQLEQEVENRLAEMKHHMQQQVEETRKTAEAAAWWIFGTATVSAACAAIAGSLATL